MGWAARSNPVASNPELRKALEESKRGETVVETVKHVSPPKLTKAERRAAAAERRARFASRRLPAGALVYSRDRRVYRVLESGQLVHAPEVPWEDPGALKGVPGVVKVSDDAVWP